MTRAEALEYYKQERERFEKTRGIQWKLSVSTWGLIALAIAYFDKHPIGLQSTMIKVLCLLFLIAHGMFAYLTQKGLIAARTRSDNVLRTLNSAVSEFVNPPVGRPDIKFTGGDVWWIFFQILSTAILLMIFLLRISSC